MWLDLQHELKKKPAPPDSDLEAEVDVDIAEEEKPERWLICRLCFREITQPETAMSIRGSHQHTHVNPEGRAFEIRCFTDAPGCRMVGDCYTYWTWFSGYAWQIAVCRGCGHHLGWRFSSGQDMFFGLIADEVVET